MSCLYFGMVGKLDCLSCRWFVCFHCTIVTSVKKVDLVPNKATYKSNSHTSGIRTMPRFEWCHLDMFIATWCRNIATQMYFIALCDAQIERNRKSWILLSVRGGGHGGVTIFFSLIYVSCNFKRIFFFKKSTNTFWCTEISTDTFQWPNFII